MSGAEVERLIAELDARLPGRVVTAGRRLRRCSTDFGLTCRAWPGVVVEARSEADVVAALRAARAHGVPVSLRGAGHSVRGQTLSDGGLVIANRGPSEPPRRLDGDLFEVSARDLWWGVERALRRHGRAVPVLADYLGLSVGGTLSVGVYGADSIVHGALVDQVERLRLIRPDGDAVWCSASEHPDLFRYGLAGLGEVGVIEKAVIRTVPYRPVTTLLTYAHRSFTDLVDSLAWMARDDATGPELFKALVAGPRVLSTYGVTADSLRQAWTVAPPEDLRGRPVRRRLVAPRYRLWRHLTVLVWVARFGPSRHIWFDYLMGYDALREFASLVEDLLAADAFAGCLKSIYVVGIRRRPDAPDLPFEAAGKDGPPFKVGVGFYTMVPRHDDTRLARVDAAADRCLGRCLELGGRPYLYGWHRLDRETLGRIYGDAVERLGDLRRELDPEGLLRGGLASLTRSSELSQRPKSSR